MSDAGGGCWMKIFHPFNFVEGRKDTSCLVILVLSLFYEVQVETNYHGSYVDLTNKGSNPSYRRGNLLRRAVQS